MNLMCSSSTCFLFIFFNFMFTIFRCLRTVSDSWDFFAEFSLGEEVINQAHCKTRKILVDGLDFQKSPSSAQHEGDVAPLSLQKGSKREHKCGSKQRGIKRLPFEDAMECLLSLKNSVVNLHQKKLFPYNPNVLLRRYVSFCCYRNCLLCFL